MPYSGINSKDVPKMDKCIKDVMAQGHDKSSAIAICHNSIVGNKKIDMNKAVWSVAFQNNLPDSLKIIILLLYVCITNCL